MSLADVEREILFRESTGHGGNKNLGDTLPAMVYDTIILQNDSGFVTGIIPKKLEANPKLQLLTTDSLKSLVRPEVLYDTDDRREFYQVSPDKQSVVSSVVCFVPKERLEQRGSKYMLKTKSYMDLSRMCGQEAFGEQPQAGYCTGFAIAGNLVATAGHCLTRPIGSYYLVFDFHLSAKTKPRVSFDASQVYSVVKVRDSLSNNKEYLDHAVLEVDHLIPADRIANLKSATLKEKDALYVAGHPAGLPLKIAGNSTVHQADARYFVADADTYAGNSGSPVFDASNCVVGILVSGQQDYYYSYRNACYYSRVCYDMRVRDCRGETIYSVSPVARFLAEQSLTKIP